MMTYHHKEKYCLKLLGCIGISALLIACNNEGDTYNQHATQHTDPSTAGWQLVWQDEFDSEFLDHSKWSYSVDCAGGGNDELQCYTDRPENSFIKEGILHLVAKEEDFSGPKFSAGGSKYDPSDRSKTLPFTSAKIHAKNRMRLRYGRIDVRAKIAGGQGMWPAIWMLPNDSVYGIWPLSGEIDIMEALNAGVSEETNEVHGTLHYGLRWPQWENKVGAFHMPESPSNHFHVYSIEWEADEIRWYVNGQHYQTQRSEGWYNYIWQGQEKGFQVANPRAPFDQDFYLIMNVAVGGNWPGDPDRNWPNDREMQIDYVRVYQCNPEQAQDPAYTGEGCGSIDDTIKTNTDKGAPGTREYSLYSDGPTTLTFDVKGGQVNNALQIDVTPASGSTIEQKQIDAGNKQGTVWDIHFNGQGTISLKSAGKATVEGYESEVVLAGGSGWRRNGQIAFDLRVKQATANSQFTIKLDSGEGKISQAHIRPTNTDEWQRVVVSIAELIKYPHQEDGGVNIGKVAGLFVLEHRGTAAHIQLDNVTLSCAYNTEPETWQLDQNCGIEPFETPAKPLPITVNNEKWLAWDCCNGADFELVSSPEDDTEVLEFQFSTSPTASGVVTTRPLDMRRYAGGKIAFDFQQVSPPPEGSVWYVKLEAEMTAAQVPLTDGGPTPNADWQYYEFPLIGEMDGTDMSNIKRLLVFPSWGVAEGAVMRIKNIRFIEP